jgi:hypothetical protein
MRDGRLAGPELAGFARHMSNCRTCADEAKAFEGLAEALRVGSAGENRDELHVARERTRLLAAFDHSLVSSEHGRGPWLLPFATAIAVFCGVLLFVRSPPREPRQTRSDAVIRADASAVWSQHVDGDVETVVLERGALAIHVDHSPSRRGRFVVQLPDGELEDIGTTFVVSAADGRTTRVVVQDGSVLLRLRNRPPVALNAGQTWTSEVGLPAKVEPVTDVPPPVKVEQLRVERAPTPRPPAPLAPATRDPSVEFRAAVRLLEAGDACAAGADFATFVRTHPRDARAEDAAYLRIIALQRCGSDEGMKAAAREYLSSYPTGFRRAEVERLSR